MKYEKIVKGKFINRPNRFVAVVEIDGRIENVHVKNTGRCKELLVKNAEVYLEDFIGRMGSRKMRYSLVCVRKNDLIINMDSQAPNKVVKEALETETIKLEGLEKLEEIKGEKVFGNSRLDFYVRDIEGREGYIEVKGVTLEKNGVAMFPDAPTERGIKHIKELCKVYKKGMNAYMIFVIQMKGMKCFKPNDETHKAFGEMLKEAEAIGVKILAVECEAKEESLRIQGEVAVIL